MKWRKFRCYACEKRWSWQTANVVYRSPKDNPLVIVGFHCKLCGATWVTHAATQADESELVTHD